MRKLNFNYSKAKDFISDYELDYMKNQVETAANLIESKTGAGNDFLGWYDLPIKYDQDEFERVKEAAKRVRDNSDVLIVIGIGGSYLGSKAAIEFLTHTFNNSLPEKRQMHRTSSKL